MPSNTTPQKNPQTDRDSPLPNLITIVGRGIPSNYELTVSGELEMDGYNPAEEATIVSGSIAEGAIDVGVQQFRFSGEMANIRVVDWNGVEGAESESTPTVHIEYGAPER